MALIELVDALDDLSLGGEVDHLTHHDGGCDAADGPSPKIDVATPRVIEHVLIRALACAALALTTALLCGAVNARAAARPHAFGARAQAYARTHDLRARAHRAMATRTTTLTGVPATGPLMWGDPLPVDLAPLNGIACPSATLCVAVDRSGGILWSTDPTGPVSAWHGAVVDPGNELTAIACPSTTECVAVDGDGNVVSSVNPTGGAAAWTVASIDQNVTAGNTDNAGQILLRGISCPATTLCVAVDAVGDAFVSGAPTGGAADWAGYYADPGRTRGCTAAGVSCQPPIVSVDCPTTTECAAVDIAGDVLTTTTPTAGVPWAVTQYPGQVRTFWGISCPTTTFCAAADGPGRAIVTVNPLAPTALVTHGVADDVYGVWCVGAQLCVGPAESPKNVAGLIGTTSAEAKRPKWTFGPPGGINDLTCSQPGVCIGVDDEGDVDTGVTVSGVVGVLYSELLPPHLPSRQVLARAGSHTFGFASAVPCSVQVDWRSVPAGAGPSTLLGSATDTLRRAGSAKVRLKLTAAGVRALQSTTRLRVAATATFATSTGQITRTKRYTFAAPPKPKPKRHHHHH